MSVYENAFDDIADFIDKGKILEKFQLENQKNDVRWPLMDRTINFSKYFALLRA